MSRDAREYRRNLAAQALGRFLYVAGGAGILIAASHVMSLADVGTYALGVGFLAIVWSFADLGTTAALGTLLTATPATEQGEMLGSFVALRLAISLVAGLVGVGATYLFLPPLLWPVMTLACLLTPLLGARFFEPVFQVGGQPQYSRLAGYLYVVVLVSTAAPVLWFAPERPDLLIGAHMLAGLAYAALGLALCWRLMGVGFGRVAEHALPILRIAGPLGLSGLLAMLNLRLAIAVLQWLRGPEDLAIFFASQRFLELGAALVATAITPMFVIFTRLQQDGIITGAAQRALALALAFGLPVVLAAPLLSGPVVGLIYGPAFAASAPVAAILSMQLALTAIGMALLPVIVAIGRQGILIPAAAAALAVNLVLCPLLVARLGPQGAAWSAVAAEAVIAGIPLIVVRAHVEGLLSRRLILWVLFAGAAMTLTMLALRPLSETLGGIAGLAVYAVIILFSGLLRAGEVRNPLQPLQAR